MESTLLTTCALFGVIVFAQATETVLGFGATILAISLGSQLMDINQLIAIMVLLGVVQSSANFWRDRASVDWSAFGRLILPVGMIGAIIGISLRASLPSSTLKIALGAIILLLSCIQLLRVYGPDQQPLGKTGSVIALILGGFFQGLSACGGPMVVYYASRNFSSAAATRATLALLWISLSLPMLFDFAINGLLPGPALRQTLFISPALVVGIAIGRKLRLSDGAHRRLSYGMLSFAGLMMMLY